MFKEKPWAGLRLPDFDRISAIAPGRLQFDNPLKSEREQASIRLGFVFLFAAIGWSLYAWAGLAALPLKVLPNLLLYVLFAGLAFWHIRRKPAFDARRLTLTTILDPLLVTQLLYAGGEGLVPFFFCYFWFTTAQAVRFGVRWMILSFLVTLICLALLFGLEPGWHRHAQFGIGLGLSLGSVGIFLAMGLARMNALKQRLIELASHDALTGLPNRSMFYDSLEKAMARHLRLKMTMAVIIFDLDGFKEINDRLGHAAGDFVLRAVAENVTPKLRRGDLIARLGGDEFGILLENVSAESEPARQVAMRIGQDILLALDAIRHFKAQPITVTASIGVTFYPQAGTTADLAADNLLNQADQAMYAAKKKGKAAIVLDGGST